VDGFCGILREMHALATRLWNVIRIQRNLGELKRTLEQGGIK
jgi:hypothetical protein